MHRVAIIGKTVKTRKPWSYLNFAEYKAFLGQNVNFRYIQ
jgi:hypothetical protein